MKMEDSHTIIHAQRVSVHVVSRVTRLLAPCMSNSSAQRIRLTQAIEGKFADKMF